MNYKTAAKIAGYSMLAGVILLIIIALASCSPTVHIMPAGCKAPKKKEYKMIEPDYPQNPKKLKYGKK